MRNKLYSYSNLFCQILTPLIICIFQTQNPPNSKMTSTVNRNRKTKILRYLLRRKQCSLILIVEGFLLTLLLILGITFIWWRSYLYKKRMFFVEQDKRLFIYKDGVTFAHCPLSLILKDDNIGNFDLTHCNNRVGQVAFAYRHWRLDEDNNDKTCLSLTEQVLCHEFKMNNWKILTNLPNEGPKCPGKKSDWNSKLILTQRFVPMQINIVEHENMILHSALLISKCPTCLSDGVSLHGNHTCEIKLHTQTPGWPWHHQKCSDYSKLFTNQTKLCNSIMTAPTTQLPKSLTINPPRQKLADFEIEDKNND